jgi:hypothetical protein
MRRFRVRTAAPPSAAAGVLVGLALLLAGAAGCSTFRLAYDNADWLAARATAEWLCPTRTQEEALRAAVRDFLAWHRRAELPRYAEVFRRVAADAEQGPLREGQVRALFDDVDAALDRAARRLARPVATLGATFGPDQRRCLTVALEASVRERRERLEGAPADVLVRRVDEVAAGLAPWVGPLTAEQRALLAEKMPPARELRAVMDARQARGLRLVALLGAGSAAQRRAALRRVLRAPQALDRPADRARLAAWERRTRDLSVELLTTLSGPQRATLARALRRYADDFAALAGQG